MILIGREHIVLFAQQRSGSKTALAMWQAVAESAAWKTRADASACFPMVSFITPQIARFPLAGIGCDITAQVAFNTGILIVLAVTEAVAQENQEPSHG